MIEAAALAAALTAIPASGGADLAAPYDGRLSFDVLREGKPFGHHTVYFNSSGDTLTIKSNIRLKVTFGPFTPFRYEHDSTEIWKGGALHSIDARTLKDGEELMVDVSRREDQLNVSGPAFDGLAPGFLLASSHWNDDVTDDSRMISTETGEIMPITVRRMGQETVEGPDGPIQATRYRLTADLSVDLWYDETGRWVKCAFSARGQDVEYVLTDG